MLAYGSGRRRPHLGTGLQQVSSRARAPIARVRLLLGLALVLPCGGCLVGPDFSRPAAPVADKWLEASNSSVDTRNQEYRDWWTVFRDPALNRLIETAFNQNLTLVSAGTRVLEARAQLGVAI